jgi:hypothetical protein
MKNSSLKSVSHVGRKLLSSRCGQVVGCSGVCSFHKFCLDVAERPASSAGVNVYFLPSDGGGGDG